MHTYIYIILIYIYKWGKPRSPHVRSPADWTHGFQQMIPQENPFPEKEKAKILESRGEMGRRDSRV